MVKQGGVISAKDMPFFSALSLHRAGCRCKEIPAVGLQRYRPLIANSGVVLQRWGRNAKVGCDRKGIPAPKTQIEGAGKTQMNMPIRNIPIKQKTEVMPRSFAITVYTNAFYWKR